MDRPVVDSTYTYSSRPVAYYTTDTKMDNTGATQYSGIGAAGMVASSNSVGTELYNC